MSLQNDHKSLKGRPFYQGKGKKYFYSLGDSRGRQAARLKATASTQTGGAVDPALLARYPQLLPSVIEKYAHILNDRPRMFGWDASKPRDMWRPEEQAAYLRDGSPKNKEDIARIMGTVGNERHYPTGGGLSQLSKATETALKDMVNMNRSTLTQGDTGVDRGKRISIKAAAALRARNPSQFPQLQTP